MAKKDVNNEKIKKNNFFKELKSELKKVTWPTFKTLTNNTFAVISVVLIVAAIVFVLDVCFENVTDFGMGKLKAIVSSDTESSEGTENSEGTEESADSQEGIDLTSPETAEGENTEVSPETQNTEENAEANTGANADSNSTEETNQ